MKKKRFLCAWERGGGSGHLFRLSTLVQVLKRKGHDVHLCVKEEQYSRRFLHRSDLAFVGMPSSLEVERDGLARSHAELLFNFGFADQVQLVAYLGRWRQLMMEVRPAAVFCDHADGALLAAYTLGIPALVIGNAFFQPPIEQPLRAYDLGIDVALSEIIQVESAVLNSINGTLKVFGVASLGSLADLYAFAERIVFSFPQLDCYGIRKDIGYVGVLGPMQRQVRPVWGGSGEKAFCYLTRGRVPDPDFVRLLVGSGYRLLIAAPGISASHRATLSEQGVDVIDQRVDIEDVCAECRLIFSEGNHSTISKILRYGRVPLLLPRQVEQLATSRRLAAQRLGVMPESPIREPIYLELIERLNSEPEYERNAIMFSEKYRRWDEKVCAGEVEASVCDSLSSL